MFMQGQFSVESSSLQTDVPGHKLSRVDQDEQSEILRVPVAMAITKLLLTLPESTLHAHLPRYSTTIPSCSTLVPYT